MHRLLGAPTPAPSPRPAPLGAASVAAVTPLGATADDDARPRKRPGVGCEEAVEEAAEAEAGGPEVLNIASSSRSVLVRANFSHADTRDPGSARSARSARSPIVERAPLQTGYVALCPLHAKKRARVCELLYDGGVLNSCRTGRV